MPAVSCGSGSRAVPLRKALWQFVPIVLVAVWQVRAFYLMISSCFSRINVLYLAYSRHLLRRRGCLCKDKANGKMPTESTMTDEGISLADEHNMRSADRFWVLRLFLLGNVVSATRHTQRIVHRVVETFFMLSCFLYDKDGRKSY